VGKFKTVVTTVPD